MRKRSILWWVFVSPFVVARNLWAARKARKFILQKYKVRPELFEKWTTTEVPGVIVPEKDPMDHHNWPEIPRHPDARTFDGRFIKGKRVDD